MRVHDTDCSEIHDETVLETYERSEDLALPRRDVASESVETARHGEHARRVAAGAIDVGAEGARQAVPEGIAGKAAVVYRREATAGGDAADDRDGARNELADVGAVAKWAREIAAIRARRSCCAGAGTGAAIARRARPARSSDRRAR